ncbi:MAG: tRNA adenylyltransferase [Pirellulales bacterium]|nr:tRNA adenylyltransferase [Pirellulales bacterium]
MSNDKLRRQIAWEAARLMYQRQETEYYRAKMKAARALCHGWVKPADLPKNTEIRDEIQALARLFEGEQRTSELQAMRIEALRMMRMLARFRPRLIGSVLTGHVRKGSDIDLHLFSDSLEPILQVLDEQGVIYDVERKQVRKDGQERIYTHVHVTDVYPFELTVYAANMAHTVFKSSITGKAIERVSLAELEQFLQHEYPKIDIDAAVTDAANRPDRYQVYESLLLPLENVKQNPKHHPEGDALYHSLQVFDHARDKLPYDEEFLTAALLHDIGKAIDPADHIGAALEALDGFITERTSWLIANHSLANQLHAGTLGTRAKRRLRQSENYQDLLILSECDRAGRQARVEAPEVDEAIGYLRHLTTMFG